jgi:hypothetical protein
MPVRSGDTISITLLHSEDVRALMDCEQSVGLISDTIELPELIATIRGVWIIKDGHPFTDPYDAQQEASFLYFGMLQNGDTVV